MAFAASEYHRMQKVALLKEQQTAINVVQTVIMITCFESIRKLQLANTGTDSIKTTQLHPPSACRNVLSGTCVE